MASCKLLVRMLISSIKSVTHVYLENAIKTEVEKYTGLIALYICCRSWFQ